MVIAIGKRDDCGHVNKAMVCDLMCPDYGIVCRRNEEGVWEAMHLVAEADIGPLTVGVVKLLPPCFALQPEALEALENPWLLDAESGEVS
jgi:hypothetical protein